MIDESTKMAKVLTMHPDAKKVLANIGMACASCSGAKHDSVRQGAINHGLDVEELLSQLNNMLTSKDA